MENDQINSNNPIPSDKTNEYVSNEDEREGRVKSPMLMDEETTSSISTKTDDEGSGAKTSSSFSASENTNDKDPESNSNECEKALEILKEFAKLGETTPKKLDFSFDVGVDDAFEKSNSEAQPKCSLDILVDDKVNLQDENNENKMDKDKFANEQGNDTREEEKTSTSSKRDLNFVQSHLDFKEFSWNRKLEGEHSSSDTHPKEIEHKALQKLSSEDDNSKGETENIKEIEGQVSESIQIPEDLPSTSEGSDQEPTTSKDKDVNLTENSENKESSTELVTEGVQQENVELAVSQNDKEFNVEIKEIGSEKIEIEKIPNEKEDNQSEQLEKPQENIPAEDEKAVNKEENSRSDISKHESTDVVSLGEVEEKEMSTSKLVEESSSKLNTKEEDNALSLSNEEPKKKDEISKPDLLPEEAELLEKAEQTESKPLSEKASDSSSTSDSDEEYYTGKECVNTSCNAKSTKYVKASNFILKYFYAKEKKGLQYICKRCNSKALQSIFSMNDMLLKGEALLNFNRPKKSELVQLIDSSDDEEKEEPTHEESSLDEETCELIDGSLDSTIEYVLKQVDISGQIQRNEQVLKSKIDKIDNQIDFLLGGLRGLQVDADMIGQKIYSCTKVNYKHVAPIDCGNLVLTDASNYVPAIGPIEFPEVMVNSLYYGQIKDALSPWVKGKIVYKENPSVYSFSFASNGKIVQKSMPKKHLAYLEPPDKRADTGARVIALYDTFKLQGKPQGNMCWMVGIIAEPAKSQNKYRYLIFFDNGYAQYVTHSNIRLICGPASQAWEDVHISNRIFIKDYLQQYQVHRPMVRTQIGQKMLVRWDGRFFSSTVVDIDCSLIQMQSDRSSYKLEWLYRGSKRLEPVYKAYRKEQCEKMQKEALDKIRAQQNKQDFTTTSIQAAKKKTYATRQPPQPVKHLNNAIIYVDDEPNNKGKIVYLTLKEERQPRPFRPHTCGKRCLVEMNYRQLKTYSPLSKPLICGWSRQIFKGKGRKFVVYKTPCGLSCRDMQTVHKYLRQTGNPLNVESFDFSWEVNCLAEYEDKSYELKIDDLSNGLEQIPVECVNYYDKTLPPPCEYSTKRIPTEGVNLNLDEEFLVGCDCEGDCSIRKDCVCWQLTLRATKFFNLNASEIGYRNKRLYEGVSTGIYECNSRCKCSSHCVNRVVQHPLELKLQVFKTNNRGWGIRCLNDIPKGCFICVYAGNLLTEQVANEGGKDHGDEYFAELDYIEVVEKQKEGYESDADSMTQSDSEDEYNPASSDLEWRATAKKPNARSTARPKSMLTYEGYEREQRKRNKTQVFDDDDSPKKYKSIRKYYGNNEACYVMDAKVTGNLGRYFNHSCDPNLYVQNVFVDTHDLRFPWVAFFSSKFIRAGTELTWNYNYEVGVVPGKVLYCECGAFNCRGRLL